MILVSPNAGANAAAASMTMVLTYTDMIDKERIPYLDGDSMPLKGYTVIHKVNTLLWGSTLVRPSARRPPSCSNSST